VSWEGPPAPYRIETERLVIRCYEPRDAPLLKEAIDSSLEHLQPWMPWALDEPQTHMDEEEAAEWLDGVLVSSANGDKKTTAAKPAKVASKTTKPAARKTAAKPAARKTAKPAAKSKPKTKARAGSR